MAFKSRKEQRELIARGMRWCNLCKGTFPDTHEYFYPRPGAQGKGRHKPCGIIEAAKNQKVRRGNTPKTIKPKKQVERVISDINIGPEKGSPEHMFFMRAAKFR